MILWGVKLQNGEMKIVSKMAQAYLAYRCSPQSEIFRLDLDESGAYSIVEGPIEIVRKDGSLYGTTSIKPYVALHIAFSLIMGYAAIQAILGASWIAVLAYCGAWLAVHKIGNDEERIQKETLRIYKKFAEDMSELLGS